MMKPFMDEDFLLSSESAKILYHQYAEEMPIFDYHCHLSAKDIAQDRRFKNLTEIWLEGDHYKWRAARSAGVEEKYITGDASDLEKYQYWATVVPQCVGNPIYHWTHLELRRPFGIEHVVFNEKSAMEIWRKCNALLAKPEFSARGILRRMKVKLVGTTDDPVDDLRYHRQIKADPTFDIEVVPTFRPDKAFKIDSPAFVDYIKTLAQVSGIRIERFADLLNALEQRLNYFDQTGCKAADHGIEIVRFAPLAQERELDRILQARLNGGGLNESEISQFYTALLIRLGKEYHKRNWVMQYHIGAIRNNNSRMFKRLGPDSGFDSIDDRSYAQQLSGLLDGMDKTDQLPKTILYCLNPRDNEMIATMIGNFQGGGIAGKIQFGSGWWFNDQKDGMERQLQQLSQLGLLSRFVGMLTDSRSFLSYTRHEYFRRILCEMIGRWVENGEVPDDMELLGQMVRNICFYNAKNYFK